MVMIRRKLDRYILGLMTRPVIAAIIVTLVAQLLERVLKIIQQLTESGAHVGYVMQLVVNLVPYYLTFSLPAAFFVSIFLVVSQMGDGNEIDAILASGVSITRFSAPFVSVGLVFMILSLALFGFLQPYGRYAYRAVLNAAINAGWNAQLQPEVFVDPGHGFTITADRVSMSGRTLHGVFVRHILPDGREQITTATSGELVVGTDGKLVQLKIDKGLHVELTPGKPSKVIRIENFSGAESLNGMDVATQPRGSDVKELTLFELSHELRSPTSLIPKRTIQAEMWGRLVRSLSVPFLPLMAIPLGMAAKRGGRAPGLILAGVLLIGFHHAVQLTQALATQGKLSTWLIWGIYGVFTGFCSWLFLSSLERPGDTPITRALAAVADAIHYIRDVFGREPEGVRT
jgi:lipopolysaccharide export system permease protein